MNTLTIKMSSSSASLLWHLFSIDFAAGTDLAKEFYPFRSPHLFDEESCQSEDSHGVQYAHQPQWRHL
jgi:hypothetical protein